MSAKQYLAKQLKDVLSDPIEGFRAELEDESNIFIWTVWFLGPKGTPYEGGHFKARFTFPPDTPMSPPEMRIISQFWHPNVYPDGKVCMSILHPPQVDEFNTQESLNIRWNPVQTLESIFLSFLTLLNDPDPSDAGAPANVDALRMYRNQRSSFMKKCKESVEASIKALPPGYVPPLEVKPKKVVPVMSEPEPSTYTFEDDAPEGEEEPDCPQPPTGGPLADELAQLRSMGIAGSDEQLLGVLKSVKGDVSRAIEKLTQ